MASTCFKLTAVHTESLRSGFKQCEFTCLHQSREFVSSCDDKQIKDNSSINSSSNVIYNLLQGNNSEPATPVPLFIDVRDVGRCHLLAYKVAKAANRRYLIYGGAFTWNQVGLSFDSHNVTLSDI